MHTSEHWRKLGNAAHGRRDFRQALDHYSRALRCPETASGVHTLLTNRSASFLQLNLFQDALADADAALRVQPGFAKALYRQALALEGLQQCQNALEAMLAAQKQLPHDVQIQEAVGRLRKAVAAVDKQSASAASSQEDAQPIEIEAPEGVHLKKCIKLQKGWLYQPSADGVDENLLILLHGYGDTPEPYARLGRQISLPQTACLALPGPLGPVAGTPRGRAWFDEEDEAEATEVILGSSIAVNIMLVSDHGAVMSVLLPGITALIIMPDRILPASSGTVATTLRHLQQTLSSLQGRDGWKASHIHLFGFSQGGSAALYLALHSRGEGMLGSCVAVSAALLPQQSAELKKQQQAQQQPALGCTPLLITHGSFDSELPRARVEATVVVAKELGSAVQFHSIPGKAHGMVGSPAEMRYLMGFWAQALKHRPMQADATEAATFVEVEGGANALASRQKTHF